MDKLDRRLSVAPMMARTDRHCRYFLRQITARTLLYSEMIHAEAVLRGDRHRLLAFDEAEHPMGLQLGGAEPDALARAAEVGQVFGYDEINLNIGCPSPRVRAGRFGAALMEAPDLVADCARAMIRAVDVPVTVKCRIGVARDARGAHDGRGAYEDLKAFVETVAAAGVKSFAVHARIAVLDGLSPAENREIPPLRYDVVRRLKRDLPTLEVVINGGVASLDEAEAHLHAVDGAMIGRAAYANPAILLAADRRIFGAPARACRAGTTSPVSCCPMCARPARTACRSTTSPVTCSGSSQTGPAGAPGGALSVGAAIAPAPVPRSSMRRSRWCRSGSQPMRSRPRMPGGPARTEAAAASRRRGNPLPSTLPPAKMTRPRPRRP